MADKKYKLLEVLSPKTKERRVGGIGKELIGCVCSVEFVFCCTLINVLTYEGEEPPIHDSIITSKIIDVVETENILNIYTMNSIYISERCDG